MKNRTILLLFAIALCFAGIKAADITQNPENNDSTSFTEIIGPAAESVNYQTLDYRGFKFEVPDFCTASGSVPYVVKSPDGTFGLSLEVGEANGSNKKRCVRYCNDVAKNLHLKNVKVEEVKINGMKGAVASGILESQNVTIVVLVKGDKELRCIVMNAPQRGHWADHAVRSIRK